MSDDYKPIWSALFFKRTEKLDIDPQTRALIGIEVDKLIEQAEEHALTKAAKVAEEEAKSTTSGTQVSQGWVAASEKIALAIRDLKQ